MATVSKDTIDMLDLVIHKGNRYRSSGRLGVDAFVKPHIRAHPCPIGPDTTQECMWLGPHLVCNVSNAFAVASETHV